HAPGAGGARPHGRGPHQHRDRSPALHRRGSRGEERLLDLRQARPAADRPGPPPGAGGAALARPRHPDPGVPMTRQTVTVLRLVGVLLAVAVVASLAGPAVSTMLQHTEESSHDLSAELTTLVVEGDVGRV